MSMESNQRPEQDLHTQQDARIDSVLQALRDAQPPPEMQTRLLARLRHAHASGAASTAQSGGRRLWLWPTHAATPWLTLAACLLTMVGTILYRTVTPGKRTPQHSVAASEAARSAVLQKAASTLTVLPADAAAAHNTTRGKGTPVATLREQTSVAADTGRTTAFPTRSNRATLLALVIRQDHVTPATAASQTRQGASAVTAIAASFPPPPLPLTQQERLLAQLLHHERSPQLSALTRSSMEEAATREKNAVEEYFATVPSVQDEQEPPAPDQPSGQP